MATGTDIALDLDPLSTTYKDVAIINGDLPTVSGLEQIQQNVLQTLGVFLGEWFLDNTIGVDYYGTVFVKNPNQAAINAMFISVILGVAGVQSVLAFNAAPGAGRTFAVSFKLQTTSGTVTYAGTLPT